MFFKSVNGKFQFTVVLCVVLFCLCSLADVGSGDVKKVSKEKGKESVGQIETTEAYDLKRRIAAWRPQLVEGVSGKAYLLDRVGAHINVEDSASLDISGNEITISAWIKPKGMRYRQEVISKSSKTDEAWKIGLYREEPKNRKISSEGRINFYLKLGNIDANFLSKKVIKPGTWYHVGCVYNGKERIIYIDGEVDSRQPVSGDICLNDEPVKIGGGGSKKWYGGSVDEVAIFNRALSAKDIRRFYLNKRKPKADEPGLVGYWSFDNDEGIVVKDGSSNQNDGKLISAWSEEHAKYSDPRQFVKIPGREGIPYDLARMYIWKNQLPILYEMLEDANYAPYWHNAARLIGYVSDDPNSIPVLLNYFKRDDGENISVLVGKIWSLAFIGKIGGPQADSILREAVTERGAHESAKAWIDKEMWPDKTWSKEEVLAYIRNAAMQGLVYTDKKENIQIVKRMYFGKGADMERNPKMRMYLLDAVTTSEYISHHGREAYFQLQGHSHKLLGALSPYMMKYIEYEKQIQQNELGVKPPSDNRK